MQLNNRRVDPAELDDSVLLPRLRQGDPAAYDTLVYGYAQRLMAVSRRFIREEAEACETVQDTFVQAFRALPRFEGGSSLYTWLYRIQVNAALMRLRSKRSRRRHEVSIEELSSGTDGFHVADRRRASLADPASEAQARERRRLIATLIDRLPRDYRVVVLLRDVEGMSTAETASVLAVSEALVKTRLHRARTALRALLVRELGLEGDGA